MENEANRYVSEIHDSAKNTVSALRHEAIGAVQREANAALYVKAEAASTAASYNSAFQREVECGVEGRSQCGFSYGVGAASKGTAGSLAGNAGSTKVERRT